MMPLGGLTTAVTKSRFSTYEYRCKKFSSAPVLRLGRGILRGILALPLLIFFAGEAVHRR